MLYYYQREFLEHDGEGIELNSLGTIATVLRETDSYKSVIHGNTIIDNASSDSEYVWEIKLIKFKKSTYVNSLIEIGLHTINDYWESYYFTESGRKVIDGFYLDYGDCNKWKEGDIIKIKLQIVASIKDRKKGTLESFINSVSSGIAFTHQNCIRFDDGEQYRLSIKMPSMHDKVELVNFYSN